MEKIRVGFFMDFLWPTVYSGGKNYMKNLLYALAQLNGNNIECYLFFGKKIPQKYVNEFSEYGMAIRTSLLDRWSARWLLYKIFNKMFNSHFFMYSILKKYNVSILSHTTFSEIDVYGKSLPFQTISFMMDFQFMHIPELWSVESLNYERNRFIARAKYSDKILLSSYDALNDMKNLVPDYIHKAKVIHFVSQPNKQIHEMTEGEHKKNIENKYEFNGKYFYLPNQFWTHKNHKVVFKAVNLLKKRGKEILVICTGLMYGADSPNRGFEGYIPGLKQYIIDNQLGNNMKLLGLIDYKDVQYFMRNSISVINPSLFEGWGSTTEEAKSIGKNVILSDIPVHKEQNPSAVIYFNLYDETELADILYRRWNESNGGPDYDLEREARENLKARTMAYGRAYHDLVLKLVSNGKEYGKYQKNR